MAHFKNETDYRRSFPLSFSFLIPQSKLHAFPLMVAQIKVYRVQVNPDKEFSFTGGLSTFRVVR